MITRRVSRIPAAIEAMTRSRPISDQFLDLLEAIPTSYVVVHNSSLSDESRGELQDFLKRGIDSGRLRLVTRYGEGPTSEELFVVTKTEPDSPAGAK